MRPVVNGTVLDWSRIVETHRGWDEIQEVEYKSQDHKEGLNICYNPGHYSEWTEDLESIKAQLLISSCFSERALGYRAVWVKKMQPIQFLLINSQKQNSTVSKLNYLFFAIESKPK